MTTIFESIQKRTHLHETNESSLQQQQKASATDPLQIYTVVVYFVYSKQSFCTFKIYCHMHKIFLSNFAIALYKVTVTIFWSCCTSTAFYGLLLYIYIYTRGSKNIHALTYMSSYNCKNVVIEYTYVCVYTLHAKECCSSNQS